MNPHDDFEDLVEPYLASGLAPGEREAFEGHLTDCAECTAALADAQEFTAFMTESLDPLRPPTGLEDRLVAGMGWRAGNPRPARRKMRPLGTWYKAAAAAFYRAQFTTELRVEKDYETAYVRALNTHWRDRRALVRSARCRR